MNAADVAAVLDKAKRNGAGFVACCPCHEDRTPSLSVSDGDTGRVLVHCHAGCSQEDVLAAIEARGVRITRDPRRDDDGPLHEHAQLGSPSATWDYFDADGSHVGRVLRFEKAGSKTFRPSSLIDGRWTWKAMPEPRPLYRLREALRRSTDTVLVTEGEKACDAAQKLFPGHVAVTWAGGANAVNQADWHPLAGRKVILWPDHDDAGRKAMSSVAAILKSHGCTVRGVDLAVFGDLPDGWDAADASLEQVTRAFRTIEISGDAPRQQTETGDGLSGDSAPEFPTLDEGRKNETQEPPPITHSDMANAWRFRVRHGTDVRYVPSRGWCVWDGRRFAHDEKSVAVTALCKETALAIYDEIRDAGDKKATFKHALHSQSKNAIAAMEYLARSEHGIPASITALDADPMLLNVANGTLDLRTGQLRPHRREDLITKLAEVVYDPGAQCPLWDAFLRHVLADNSGLIDYVQRLAGYLLTGSVREQVLHFLHGGGSNGKTVVCEILRTLLGEYALVANPEMIMARRHAGIPNDIARLRSARLVIMNETSQGARFDEAKLKDLTGGDTLSARFLHAEYFDFAPTHKLVIRGNHKPAITGCDEGIWRRLRLIPFGVQIPEAQQDRTLVAKLCAELPGILRWAVEGCLTWQQGGLNPPEIVTDAVKRYREESDVLGRFIGECCDERKLAQVKSSAFFKRYQQYCEQAGERWIPSKDLPAEMERRGYTWKRTKLGGMFYGVELRVEHDWRDRE